MAFIIVTIVLDALASTITLPVLPQYLKSLTGGEIAQMSIVFGTITTLSATMQLFAAPIQGGLSDRFGRRPVILISNFGLGIGFVMMALAPNLAWVFASTAVSGIAAGSVAAAYAYIADVTAPDKRAARFGLLAGALSAGGATGALLGGFVGEVDVRAPFWVAAGLSFGNFLYGSFVLPESLPPGRRAPLTWRTVHPVGAVMSIWRDYPIIKGWQAAAFLMSFGNAGVNSIFFLYVTFRFGWTPKAIGFYAAFVMVSNVIVQAGLVGRAIKVLGERGTLLGGIALQAVAGVAAGLAFTGVLFAGAVFLLIVGAASEPARLAIINRFIGASDRGRLSGADRSIYSVTGIFAPVLFAMLFSSVVDAGPTAIRVGAPLFVCAALTVAGFAVTLWSVNRSPTVALTATPVGDASD